MLQFRSGQSRKSLHATVLVPSMLVGRGGGTFQRRSPVGGN